jgi:hypothetical protein
MNNIDQENCEAIIQSKRKRVNIAVQSILIGSTLIMASAASLHAAPAEKGLAKTQPAISINTNKVLDDRVQHRKYTGEAQFSISSPVEFNGDTRSLPNVTQWHPGDAVKVANPRHIGEITSLQAPVNRTVKSQQILNRNQKAGRTSIADMEVGVKVTGFEFNGVNPPDPTGEIGENYYIHAINGSGGSEVSIFEKATGNKVGNSFNLASLASGDCQSGLGDPVIIYDEYAKRWMMTEFSTEATKKLCVYISKTADPITGGWYAYEFAAPEFPDYPKYSVWGGNYYVSANESGGAVYALQREKMLAGEPAAMVRKAVPSLAGFGFQSITPIDADGTNPPADGTPGLFIRHRDDELHNAGSNNAEKDFIELWTFTPDFVNADNSQLAGPFNIEIAEMDSNFTCPDNFGCLTQKPEDGQSLSTLDPLKEVVNFKVQYRNFNSHQSITGSFVTKLEANNAGLRWFELRKTNDDWALHQEGMVPATDNNSRYMAGAAQDGDGNIALAYMITGPEQFPSIRATGRRMGDALGTISADEITLFEADGSIATERDGDYAQLSVDPIDNCTFWHTAEYGGAGSKWKTGVSSFKFPGCTGTGSTEAGYSLSASNRTQEVCLAGELQPIAVTISGYNDFDKSVSLSYADLAQGLTGQFSVNPVAAGATSSAVVTVASGVAAGDYSFSIKGASEGLEDKNIDASVKVVASEQTASLSSPENGAVKVDYTPELSWSSDGYIRSYTIEIATDEAFANIVATGQVSSGTKYRPSQSLPQSTEFFWRVKAANVCGETMSSVYSFTTGTDKDKAEELLPNVAKSIQGDEGQYADYYIDIPSDVEKLTLKISGGDGDVDLYAGFGKIAQTADDLVCRSEAEGNNESCVIEDVQQGTYFITTAAYSTFTGAELVAEFEIPNAVPVAVNDSYTVQQDSSDNSFNVLINDSDADAEDTLTLVSLDYSGTGNVSIVNGNISYTPKKGFFGSETIGYTLKDDKNATAQATVAVTVEEKPSSGGGSMGVFALLALPFVLYRRTKKYH